MTRKVPSKLKEKQDKQRQETLNKIEEAIQMYKNLGYGTITITNLVSATELARSTFSKPHVEELLKEHKIGKFKETKTLVIEQEAKYTKENVERLEKQLNNALIKINKLESQLATTTARLKEEQTQLLVTDLKNKELADKFQRMYDKLVIAGVKIIF